MRKIADREKSETRGLIARRAAALYIDFVVMIAGMYAVGWTVIYAARLFGREVDDSIPTLITFPLAMAYLICRDLLRPSVGKRVMGLRVVTVKGGEPTTRQLVRRGLSLFFWPAEISCLMRTGGRQRKSDVELGLMTVMR